MVSVLIEFVEFSFLPVQIELDPNANLSVHVNKLKSLIPTSIMNNFHLSFVEDRTVPDGQPLAIHDLGMVGPSKCGDKITNNLLNAPLAPQITATAKLVLERRRPLVSAGSVQYDCVVRLINSKDVSTTENQIVVYDCTANSTTDFLNDVIFPTLGGFGDKLNSAQVKMEYQPGLQGQAIRRGDEEKGGTGFDGSIPELNVKPKPLIHPTQNLNTNGMYSDFVQHGTRVWIDATGLVEQLNDKVVDEHWVDTLNAAVLVSFIVAMINTYNSTSPDTGRNSPIFVVAVIGASIWTLIYLIKLYLACNLRNCFGPTGDSWKSFTLSLSVLIGVISTVLVQISSKTASSSTLT